MTHANAQYAVPLELGDQFTVEKSEGHATETTHAWCSMEVDGKIFEYNISSPAIQFESLIKEHTMISSAKIPNPQY